MKPVMFEGMMANGFAPGGQLTTTTDVENYPGFPEGVLGGELMDKMRAQSIRCGTVIETETITKLDLSSSPFKIWREGSENKPQPTDTASAVVFATGASARRMHLPGEDKYWQNGISACAVCDGAVPIFRNKPLVVVGGGDSAAEESIYLTKCKSYPIMHDEMKNDVGCLHLDGSHVHVLVRRDVLRASKVMAQRLLKHPKITVHFNTVATEAKGDGSLLTSVATRNTKTGEAGEITAGGLFYAIGHDPATSLIKDQVDLDEDGYVKVVPGSSETSVKGLFACGDVVDKRYRQAVTSAGTGCMAALDAERYLTELQEEQN